MERLSEKDIPLFLESGQLTTPFLKNEYVADMVLRDYIARLKMGKEASILSSLYNWIATKVEYCDDQEFQLKNKFKRSSKEIWESKLATGCTDYALLFATFARQIGLPCTILHTAEEEWVLNLHNGKGFDFYKGHTFCECYYEEKWVLVDPTVRKVIKSYNQNKIELDYLVGGSNKFIPYSRALDLEGMLGLQAHNSDMEERCKKIPIKRDVKIVQAEEKHYEGIKDLLVELQEYIVKIDKFNLNVLTDDYREGYFKKTLEESLNGGGTMLVAEEDGEVVGMIAGHLREYDENDKLDFTCPKMGIIEELVVRQGRQNGGIGKLLVEEMERYFAQKGCSFIKLDVFAYNQNAYQFYLKENYEDRLFELIKKIK